MQYLAYEIFLGTDSLAADDWRQFFQCIQKHLHFHSKWHLMIKLKHRTLHYYIITTQPLPLSFGMVQFLLKPHELPAQRTVPVLRPFFNVSCENLAALINCLAQRKKQFLELRLDFCFGKTTKLSTTYLTYKQADSIETVRLVFVQPETLLAIDFSAYKTFLYKKIPKYLNLEKVLPLFSSETKSPLLRLDAFPYSESSKNILPLDAFDFWKSTLVLGSSGSGKSRFLSLFINSIYCHAPDNYKVVVIDPHAALQRDFGDITSRQIINFKSDDASINLFDNNFSHHNVAVELMLDLFKTLIINYNGHLERVLRYTLYVLIALQRFSFMSLRCLLTDLEYRNQLLADARSVAPDSVIQFFATDFNDLRLKFYAEAIAPLIAFVDEMQMVPVFNAQPASTLSDRLEQKFLTVFSLDQLYLGERTTQMIAGLLFQQIFLFAKCKSLTQHLIVVIDEVPVIEKPILTRFLAELRKYNVSVVLAGQYLGQFTPELRAAIWANVPNYFIFHTAKSDSELLARNLEIKLVGSDKLEDSQKLFTGLAERECLVQLSRNGKIKPAFKAKTADYTPSPAIDEDTVAEEQREAANLPTQFKLELDSDCNADDLMHENSTSRKILKQ